MTAQFPELAEALQALDGDVVLDGELVVLDEHGRPAFERLVARSAKRKPESIRKEAAADPAVMFAFDLLWLNGEDYRHFPVSVRKAQLSHVLKTSARIKYAEHFENSSAELWAFINRLELEGIVVKEASSTCRAGRSDRWLKIKAAIGIEREKQRERR